MIDADYDYILDEIEHQEKIEFEWIVSGNSDNEWYLCKNSQFNIICSC